MKLIYYRGAHRNFGDDLNEFLWPQLVPDLFDDAAAAGFLGIGTIIGIPTPGCETVHVFSSGIGYDPFEAERHKLRVWCVRGPLSARLLGCEPDVAITDGAILTPLVLGMDPGAQPRHRVSVMLHWESMLQSGWQDACDAAGFNLISPIGPPGEVIAQLRQTELLITESLHGAILADTYQIPWIPIVTSGNFSVFKWADWCLSVEVPLRLMNVPPPSASAMLKFGRPRIGSWGAITSPDAAAAMEEFHRRVAVGGASPARPLKRLLRPVLHRAIQHYPASGRIFGLGIGRTAELLTRAAKLEPSLSRASLRERLRERMLEQLRALTASAGVTFDLRTPSFV